MKIIHKLSKEKIENLPSNIKHLAKEEMTHKEYMNLSREYTKETCRQFKLKIMGLFKREKNKRNN